MSKKTQKVDTEKEEPPICRSPHFAPVLSHASQMIEHILDEVPEDALENSHVTLSADFVVDCFDLLLEYALRYEPEFQEIYDDLLLMYHEQSKRKAGFGTKTRH